MKNKKVITIVLAAMLACTAVTACGKKEATDEFEKTVEVETDVVAETEEPEVIESEVAAEPEVVDTTYCKLMSDPNFDMENAVRDDMKSDAIMNNEMLSKNGYEVLFNYVDGARYAELTGETATEVNETITMYRSGVNFFPHLAYYGIDPNPYSSEAMNMFALIDTSYNDEGTPIYADIDELTVFNTYSIPEKNIYVLGIDSGNGGDVYVLCEVEYKGEQGYAIMRDTDITNGMWKPTTEEE